MERKRSLRIGAATLVGLSMFLSEPGVAQADEFEQLSPIAPQELSTVRGRDGNSLVNVQSNQNLSATISETTFTAGQINSGTVQLEDGALNNFTGVGLFNFVTGNGNAIDAAIGVNIYLQ